MAAGTTAIIERELRRKLRSASNPPKKLELSEKEQLEKELNEARETAGRLGDWVYYYQNETRALREDKQNRVDAPVHSRENQV